MPTKHDILAKLKWFQTENNVLQPTVNRIGLSSVRHVLGIVFCPISFALPTCLDLRAIFGGGVVIEVRLPRGAFQSCIARIAGPVIFLAVRWLEEEKSELLPGHFSHGGIIIGMLYGSDVGMFRFEEQRSRSEPLFVRWNRRPTAGGR